MEDLKKEFIRINKPERFIKLLKIIRGKQSKFYEEAHSMFDNVPSYEGTVEVEHITKGGIKHKLSFTYDELKEICSTLPHVPNKKESKLIRKKKILLKN